MRAGRPMIARAAAPGSDQPVTTLELFFDLVFVFTITQVTDLVRADSGATGYLHAAGILALTWWMYDGYAWLSNNVGPTTISTRVPMLLGMFGFLVMAIASQQAFGGEAWAFALAYVLVVLVHAAQFSRSALGGSARAIRQILPINLGVALLLVAAAVIGEDWGWVCWAAGVALLILSAVRRRESGFSIRAEHFAERHQLVVIIALGETVIATGAGAQGHLDDALVLIAVAASLALLGALWWVYFGGDDERSAVALARVDVSRTSHVAFLAFGLGHLVHVAGLVLVAAGLHEVVAEPAHALSWRLALTMGVGVAVFLLAQAYFRRTLAFGPAGRLLVGAVVAVGVAPLGRQSALTELLGLVAVVVLTVLWVHSGSDPTRTGAVDLAAEG